MNRKTEEIERRLEELAEVNVVVEDHEEFVVVSGIVADEEEHDLVIEVLNEFLPDARIEDNLEVSGFLPEEIEGVRGGARVDRGDVPRTAGGDEGTEAETSLEPGDFTDQNILKDPDAAIGASSARANDQAREGDVSYVPPTDPVRRPDNEVLGGFSTTSFGAEVARSVSDDEIGDGAIADAVRRELREDSATADLDIRVLVRNGIVVLRGRVRDLDDAENAEEVAARVPGVMEVREELEVADLE